jgi:hypothetical protein
LLFPATPWLEFLPGIAAVVWLVLYWLHGRDDWQWNEQMPLLLLLSVATIPYGWFFDEVVLLPAVLQIAAVTFTAPRRRWLWPAMVYFAVNVLTLGLVELRFGTRGLRPCGLSCTSGYCGAEGDHVRQRIPDKSVATVQARMYPRKY